MHTSLIAQNVKLICVVLMCLSATAHSALPKFIELQSGSLMGLGHVSVGITLDKSHHFSVGIGYIPERFDHEEMTLTSIKYRYEGDTRIPLQLWSKALVLSPYNFGIANLTGHQDEIYRKNPEYLPDGYYYPTARRIVFNYQPYLTLTNDVQAYLDWSILDVGLINYARNFKFYNRSYRALGLEGIVTFGFGMRVTF